MLKPAEVAELLSTLHQAGYRLRKLGPDTLEVEEIDSGPKLRMGEQSAQREQPQDPLDDDAAWDHVGGRPEWVRRPKGKSEQSPWKDSPGEQ